MQPDPIDTIGIYEVLRDPKGGMRLLPTWRFKACAWLVSTHIATACPHDRMYVRDLAGSNSRNKMGNAT